ncbi:dihydrolipoyl dehydrogenase family protein [Sneathiella sp. HT1-7]|uniref:dihydrolipoyl dehydrogenase family protein n=1 Tax=Sneathiella sp. HT1-7 TaxID=2887192 RepID=UPI001D1466C1|nr:FAD-dependent oxidoreductase [Sneathiella sp. HT1-7]MCC3303542.1 FAD-dependent oxidoreductase [Sneathiella sp. HT1-7]
MANQVKTDICVIGGGSGGLSVAAGASQMGAKTVLIEGSKMGGDCLNYGCVPSKALIAAAKKASCLKNASDFGITGQAPSVDFPKVMDHVQEVIGSIAPHDSVERFEELGVEVIQGYGRFVSENELEVGDTRVTARRFVIATGSSATAPPIPGLEDAGYLTNETIFENRVQPDHLIVIGGGPIGLEMAQAHARLGSKVTVLEAFKAFGRDDPGLSAVVLKTLREEGVDIREGVKISDVKKDAGGAYQVSLGEDSSAEVLVGSHLLVAAGRKANVEGLNLEAAGVEYSPKGVTVDSRLRSTNKKIYAIGDAAGSYQFTHIAGYHAGIFIRNALFRLPAKVDYSAVPWVTFTDPELANVGLSEDAAREQYGDKIKVLSFPFADIDRARAERQTDGMIKAITTDKGRILGAGIVGPHAGELIHPWGVAITGKLKIGTMASYIAPYPTLGEISKRAAGSYYTPSLFSSRTRAVVKFLSFFG